MMKSSVLGFIILVWSGRIFTTSTSQPQSEDPPVTCETFASVPIFPRTWGLVADPSNSFAISVLNMLYSIPRFQEAVYAEADVILSTCDLNETRQEMLKTSIVVATAVVFAHLRMGLEPLDLGTFFYEACQNAFGKPIKDRFVLINRFLRAFLNQMPPRISSLYKHQSRISFFKIPDLSLVVTVTMELMMAKYPLAGNEISLGDYIKQKFFEPTFSCTGPDGTIIAGIEVTISEEIMESPEILFFEVPRAKLVGSNKQIFEMSREKIYFEKEITVHRVKYFLVGYSPFNHETSTYSTMTRDFGNMEIYEIIDGKVSGIYVDSLVETFRDGNTSLLVYARSDTLNQFDREGIKNFSDIPESVKKLAFSSGDSDEADLFDSIPDDLFDLFDLFATEFGSDNFLDSSSITAPVPVAAAYSGFSINPKASLIVPRMNSFISSLFMAFYNIPDLQRAIYDDATENLSENSTGFSTKIAIAAAFAQLRLNGEKVDATDYLLEAISMESKNEVIGTFSRLSVFARNVSSLLGRNYKEQVEIHCESTFTNSADSKHIGKSMGNPIFTFVLQLSGPFPRSVAYYAQNNFEELTKTTRLEEKIVIDISNKIHNSSTYLFLDINRVDYDKNVDKISVDNTTIFIDSEIKMNEIDYILIARIEFDRVDMTYSTIIKDFHSSVIYKFSYDGTVQVLQDVAAAFSDYVDTATTFLIYGDKSKFYNSYTLSIEIPEIIKPVLHQIEAEGQWQKSRPSTKRKREESPIVLDDLVYRPDYSAYPQNIQEFFPNAESRISAMKMMNYPFSSINFMSKYYYGVYILGSEEYSFKDDSDSLCLALKVLLSQMAGSVRFVTGLFEFLEFKKKNTLELNLAVVISRMLMGCRNIPITSLLQEILKKSRSKIEFHSTERDHHHLNLNEQLQAIILLIDPYLIALPKVKKVIYPDLITSDPCFVSKYKLIPVKEKRFCSPSPADIRGAWFDAIDSSCSSSRRIRTIYSSPAIIFPVEISRDSANSVLVEAASMDKNSDGFICELFTEMVICSYVLDKFSGKYRVLIWGSDSFSFDPSNEEYLKFIQTRKLGHSIQLFMTSKDDQVQQVYSSNIPNNIIQLALEQILSESTPSTEDTTSHK